jgi:hypothetical protein
LAGCGAGPVGSVDAGQSARRLEALNTDSLGLAFGEQQIVEARYTGAGDRRLPGEKVSFFIVADTALGETAAGASLSDAEVLTDEDGVARVSVTGGSTRSMFRVRATAAFAPAMTYYVSVSDAGFVALEVTPERAGFRPASDFGSVEIRLYASTCGAVLPPTAAGQPPETPMPPRTATAFAETVQFPLLPADTGLAVLAWAPAPGGAILAAGCVDLAPAQLRPATTLRFGLAVPDVPLRFTTYRVTSLISLAPLFASLRGEGWRVATCPRGAAQVILDCAIDALDPGDPADDCVIVSPGPVATDLLARRGAMDAEGCRPATVAAQPSIDALVETALEADAQAPARALAGSAALLADLLDEVQLISRLSPTGQSASHVLQAVTLELAGVELTTILTDTARPVLAASATWDLVAGRWALGDHGFTLRLGPLAREAFAAGALVPAGISADPDDLGSALVDAAEASTLSGCAAVSSVACTAAARPADCLAAACSSARPMLDDLYDVPFTKLGAGGVDLALRGSAIGTDEDLDVTAEALLGGAWDATLTLDMGVGIVAGMWEAAAL